MKKRKMSAHINIVLAKILRHDCRALQKRSAFIVHAKYMREAFGVRRKQRYSMYLYRERKGNYAKVNV